MRTVYSRMELNTESVYSCTTLVQYILAHACLVRVYSNSMYIKYSNVDCKPRPFCHDRAEHRFARDTRPGPRLAEQHRRGPWKTRRVYNERRQPICTDYNMYSRINSSRSAGTKYSHTKYFSKKKKKNIQ